MELSDEQIMLKAWEVATRRGWEFAIISLMRGGVDFSSRGLRGRGVAGLFGELGDERAAKSDCDIVMASQESSEDEEQEEKEQKEEKKEIEAKKDDDDEEEGEEAPCEPESIGAEMRGGSWRKIVVHRKSSSIVLDPDLKLRIKLFGSKVATAVDDCFSRKVDSLGSTTEGLGMDAEKPTLPTSATQVLPLKFSQTSTLGSKVGHNSSWFPHYLGDKSPGNGFPSVAVVKPTTLTLSGTEEEFLWPVNVAAHVSKELRETVVSLKFFDMFSLLPDCGVDKLSVVHRSLSEWQKGFSIMGSILLEDVPDKMKGFFNYGEIINKAHDAVQGEAWIKYDEEFRKLKENNPDMSWAIIHSQLWLQIIPPALAAHKKPKEDQSKPSGSDESSMGHVSKRYRVSSEEGHMLAVQQGVCA